MLETLNLVAPNK